MKLTKAEFRQLVSIVNRAKIECRRERYISALRFLEQATEVYPPPLEDWVGAEQLCIFRGDVYFLLNDYENARYYYLKSKKCIDKSQHIETDFKIGKTFYEEGNYEEAKKVFKSIFTKTEKKYFLKEKAKYYHLISSSTKPIS